VSVELRAYASRTGTKRNKDALRLAGWGILICASKHGLREHRDEGFSDVMLDNGAWKVRSWPSPAERLAAWLDLYEQPWLDLLDLYGHKARLVVVPDVYSGGHVSLSHSLAWLARLRVLPGTLLLPVQDGLTPDDVRPHLGPNVGLFVGGSDTWKWDSLREAWGPLAQELGCWLHVGKAGSGRMVERCGIRRVVKTVVRELDHKVLNEVILNPTAERIALYLWDCIDDALPRTLDGCKLVGLRLLEGHNAVELS